MTEAQRSSDTPSPSDGGSPPDPESHSEFFRTQAIEHATPGLAAREGQILVAVPPRTLWLGVICAVTVLVAALCAAIVPFSRTESATGWLTPAGGLVRVKATRTGVVSSIEVPDGGVVEPGTPIVGLSHRIDGASGSLGRSLIQQLDLEAEAIRRETEVTALELSDRIHHLSQRMASLDEQIAADQRTVQLFTQQLEIARQAETRSNGLASSGYLSAAALENVQSRVISAESSLLEQRARQRASQLQREETASEISRLVSERDRSLAAESQRLASIEQRRLSTATDTATLATAPVGGRIVALPMEPGRSVDPGDTLAIMAVGGGPLSADVYISQRGIGRIAVGQPVRVNLEAFPYQTFGSIDGTVVSVSETALSPSEIDVPGLVATGTAFRVRIALDQQTTRAYDREIPLRPGMAISAFIITDRRSILAWLLDPIFAAGRW